MLSATAGSLLRRYSQSSRTCCHFVPLLMAPYSGRQLQAQARLKGKGAVKELENLSMLQSMGLEVSIPHCCSVPVFPFHVSSC